jgi:1-phosphofructokinase family hexose kinase
VIAVGGFNTALDKLAETDAIERGAVLRLRNVRTLPGGKGLHVALACATLGVPATLVGLTDDATRPLFETTMAQAGGRFVGVKAGQPIRTCLALVDPDGRTTELLEAGPEVSPAIAQVLLDTFRREASAADIVVLSGSLPPGLPGDTYATLVAEVGRDRTALDSSGAALEAGLAAAPLLVKPNRSEAGQIVGFGIASLDDAARAAGIIGRRGPRCVVLSLGADGAVIWTPDRVLHVAAPPATPRNTVGAGDCLLAGFAIGLSRGWSTEECGRYGVACGTAKITHPETGLLRAADVETLARAISVTSLPA